MAQIPQINNPITSKNYNYSSRPMDENTEPFDIVQLAGVGGAGVSGDKQQARSQFDMGNKELIPLSVLVAKDPTLAVETLKDLLNIEVLNQALITGHTELYGKLEQLARELYVTPEQLVKEIQNQEQQNTMFSGHEFYDVLREVAKTTTDPDTKELVGNLLKSLNFAQNKGEIIGALRANMKFLSEYFSPNEKLSARLMSLSHDWGADDAEEYFDYLKNETLSILKDVSGSLLNDEKTQTLIPLIVHNLSRYNNNPYMLKENFNLLLTQIPSNTLRESLQNSFNRLFNSIFKVNEDSPQPYSTNYTTNYTENQPEKQNVQDNFTTDVTNTQNDGVNTVKNADYRASSEINGENAAFETVAAISNGKGDASVIQNENGGYGVSADANTAEAQTVKNADLETASPEDEMSDLAKFFYDKMGDKEYLAILKESGYDIRKLVSLYTNGRATGVETLKGLIQGLLISGGEKEKPDVLSSFMQIRNMPQLIDYLNEVLKEMPDVPLRQSIYNAFTDIIDKMAVKNELPPHGVRPPVSSTLDNLTDFIQENINHPALKSLDSFNASNLLQSLLNAPGVFTPLAHYILPLQVDGTKSFGELWVDNDENNPNNTPSTQRNYHLFLTFDVETIGRFELDMYALGEDVSLTLLYPTKFETKMEPMKERIEKTIRTIGYNTKTFATAPLKTPHNLTEIFPKILDKRTSLNVRV